MALALLRTSRMIRALLAVACLLIPATSHAEARFEAEPETKSYRHFTLAADLVGLSLLVAGGFAEGENGRDTAASDALFTAGGLTMILGTPMIHAARGHRGRAVGGVLMRFGAASMGGLLAIQANSGCDDGQPPPDGTLFDDDFLCELDYVGYGVIGGLVVAALIDAALMTDEPVDRASTTWAPHVAANRDGVRAGVAFAW